MNIDKKLSHWRAAGIIDDATAARIATFERAGQRPILLYALGGLGALTLGIGIISVIAANWHEIPRTTKLGLDLALGAALALALFRSWTRGDLWLTDVLVGVYYVFTLGSIALLGQVYQLGSPQYQGLLTWSLATAPFMLLVRGRLLGTVWLAGLALTHALTFVELFVWMERRISPSFALNFAVSATFASTLAYVIVARIPWFVRERPQVSGVWTRVAWTCIVLAALALSVAFYDDIDDDKLSWAVAVCGILAAGMVTLLPKLYPDVAPRARTGMTLLLASFWFLLATATTLSRDAYPAFGALSQIGVLGIAAWTVLALGSVRSFNMLTAIIALRVLVIYFEVFGSMLDTGLGLITGGLLTLLLAWAWKRKSPELAERLSTEGTSGHAS